MALEAAHRRRLLVDVLAVAGLAVLLVAIHLLLPAGLRDGLTLRYGRPDPVRAWTAAYVHLTDAHLVGNVGGLVAGGGWAIAVSQFAGERRWFRLSLLSFVTVLPIAIGLSGAVFLDEAIVTRGFSGVVAGFGGFGLVAVAVVLQRVYGVDRRLAWTVTAGLSVILAAEILWLVTGRIPLRAAGLLLAGIGFALLPIGRAAWRAGWPGNRDQWRWLAAVVSMTCLLGAMPLGFVVGLFPTEIATAGSITNILGHYLGLVYGAVIAGWGYRYWTVEPAPGRRNRRS